MAGAMLAMMMAATCTAQVPEATGTVALKDDDGGFSMTPDGPVMKDESAPIGGGMTVTTLAVTLSMVGTICCVGILARQTEEEQVRKGAC